MTGKSGNTVVYTAEDVERMVASGQGRTEWEMPHEEAMRRRYADPEAPRPYPGWRKTIIPGVPEPKAQLSVSVDRDVLDWFRSTGPDFEERINRALREFMQTHRDGTG